MIVAQAQRDRLQQRLHALSPEAAAEAAADAEALAGGTSSEGDVVRGQLQRIAELEREVKRLKQVSRCAQEGLCGLCRDAAAQVARRCGGVVVSVRGAWPAGPRGTSACDTSWLADRLCPPPNTPTTSTGRLSGAFGASMQRQSLAPGATGGGSDLPPSPFHLSPLIQSDTEEDAEVAELSNLELNDEEFAAHEQAHT